MVGEAVTEIAYGADKMDGVDFVSMGEELTMIVSTTVSGYLVDLLPFRNYFLTLTHTLPS